MKIIGWIGILHAGVLVIWMAVNILFSLYNPVTFSTNDSMAETGIAFYSNYPGYLGFDHGSKALVMLASIVLPIGIYMYLKKTNDFQLQNSIAVITGCLGFAFYGLSLMLQAVTVEYAFNLYRTNGDIAVQSFAVLLYEWSMLEGGLSVSIYIIANLLIACWVMMHSLGLLRIKKFIKLSIFGMIVGLLLTSGYLLSWFFLMQANQNMHEFNEATGLLFVIWILLISIRMVQGKISLKEEKLH